ncbi:hypothetical protein PM082_020483 [Marasmius tenuissimus]|nr:hypothetical protein PM082_024130 [Marasmius tenuissimus]KAJ8093623.1 hypothetical protein PM082_020483 [Marasmius tenuissimus]
MARGLPKARKSRGSIIVRDKRKLKMLKGQGSILVECKEDILLGPKLPLEMIGEIIKFALDMMTFEEGIGLLAVSSAINH